ncbi:MAG: hypothetical protein V1716_04725 [Candidatus Uhrbacteria bacterium]
MGYFIFAIWSDNLRTGADWRQLEKIVYNWLNTMSGRRWWWAVFAVSAVLSVAIPGILLVPIVAVFFSFYPIGDIGYSNSPHLEAWSFMTIPLPDFVANNANNLFLFFLFLFLFLFLIPVTIFCHNS